MARTKLRAACLGVLVVSLMEGTLRAGQGPPAVPMTEEVLAEVRDHFVEGSFNVSEDGKRYAFVTCSKGLGRRLLFQLSHGRGLNPSRCEAIVDGRVFGPYSDVTQPIFSRDGTRFAFAAAPSQRVFDESFLVVVDGEATKEYEGIGGSPVFSPNGKRVAYARATKKAGFAVIDGVESPGWGYIYTNQEFFGPDSAHVAYLAQKDKEWAVVLDGTRLEETAARYISTLRLLDKGLLFASRENGQHFVVARGTREGPYEDISQLVLSKDRRHYAYVAKLSKKKFVVVHDGRRGEEFQDEQSFSAPHLSGGRFFYSIRRGDRAVLVIDGKDAFWGDGPAMPGAYSADEQHFAFAALRGGETMLFRDGRESRLHAMPEVLVLSPSGTQLLYGTPDRVLWQLAENTPAGRQRLETGDQLQAARWTDEHTLICYALDGKRIVTRTYTIQ